MPKKPIRVKDNDALHDIQTTCADVRRRRLYLLEGVEESAVGKLIIALDQMDADADEPITLFLNTGGGCSYDSLALYDAIRAARSEVKIIGLGSVMSAGLTVLQAGDQRLLASNARLLIHDGSWEQENSHALLVVVRGKEMAYEVERHNRIYAHHTKQPIEKIRKLSAAETYLGAYEAVTWGFADAIYTGARR